MSLNNNLVTVPYTGEHQTSSAALTLAPRIELNLVQNVREAALSRLLPTNTQQASNESLINRSLALPNTTSHERDWVHVPVDFAEGVPLMGPTATPRLKDLWNSFLSIMQSIQAQYDRPATGNALAALSNRSRGLVEQFSHFFEIAARLTAAEVQTLRVNLPAAFAAVSERLPSREAITAAVTSIQASPAAMLAQVEALQQRIPGPVQQVGANVIRYLPTLLAPRSALLAQALMQQFVSEATSRSSATRRELEAPQGTPTPPVGGEAESRVGSFFTTQNLLLSGAAIASTLITIAAALISQQSSLESHCSEVSEDNRPFYDFMTSAPPSFEECMSEGWPRV